MKMTSAAANSALRQLAARKKADGEWNCVDEEKSLLLLLRQRDREIESGKRTIKFHHHMVIFPRIWGGVSPHTRTRDAAFSVADNAHTDF
jgi:hypothetical protein